METPLGDDENPASILQDTLWMLHPHRTQCQVTLCTEHLVFVPTSKRTILGQKGRVLPVKDIVGCQDFKAKCDDDKDAYLTVFAYPRCKRFASKKKFRKRQAATFVFSRGLTYDENQKDAQLWRLVITALVNQIPVSRPQDLLGTELEVLKRMLVFINPHSGPGNALRTFRKTVAPCLIEAGMKLQVTQTEYNGHAKEIVQSLNINDYYGIIIVSGDGLVFEVLNGLMKRPDWQEALKIPIGVVPAGSANGLCVSINKAAGEQCSHAFPVQASFLLAKHVLRPMDIIAVDTTTERLYSLLVVMWGLLADVDIDSERLRRLGSIRFDVVLAQKLLRARRYRGRLSFLPVDEDQKLDQESRGTVPKDSGTETHDGVKNSNNNERPEVATNLLVPLDQPVPDNWTVIEDEFAFVMAVYKSHLSSRAIASTASLHEGAIHLTMIRACVSRAKILGYFLKADTGAYLNDPGCEVVRVRAFRLEPLTESGHLTVDGEPVQYGPLQAQVLPYLATVMAGH